MTYVLIASWIGERKGGNKKTQVFFRMQEGEAAMNPKAAILIKLGEFLGAGMYERENDTIVERYALGLRRYFENSTPPPETGLLYPAPEQNIWNLGARYITYHYAYGMRINVEGFREHARQNLTDPFELDLVESIIEELSYFNFVGISSKHKVGGTGWTHTVLNYPRILKEGLKNYIARVEKMSESPLKNALTDTLAGLVSFLKRAPGNLEKEVMEPAENFVHAMRSFNFFFSLEVYDSAGRFDEYMGEYYKGEPEAQAYLEELFKAVDKHAGWHFIHTCKYPEFTKLCLRSQHHSRPNCGMLITPETTDDIWNAVFDQWEKGVPCPSLYNLPAYLKSLEYYGPEIRKAAEELLSFGGCTESMFQGCSNIGSTDGGVNLLEILAAGGEKDFFKHIRNHVEQAVKEIRLNAEFAAAFRPHLIRTLFVDDCIDRELEYHSGGARYNGSAMSVAGLTNAANAIAAMRNINEKFGNDQDQVDEIAREIAEFTFGLIREQRTRLDGMTFPAVIIFTQFGRLGKYIPATADGRAAGAPVVDSFGAVAGTDKQGPTALLKSVAKLPGHLASGTPILNIRFQKKFVREQRPQLKALIQSFFQLGGMQLQVTVADQEMLKKAYEDPEAYPNLMIRIGGYSTYFNYLDRKLQAEVLKRYEHSL